MDRGERRRGRILITQDALLPSIIKQRHMAEGNRFIRAGKDANLPASGETTLANSTACYFATDTNKLYIWNGTWKSVTLV